MSYQVLARKWRPKRFQEVVGQDHITKTLINSIRSNKIAQAYLLTGTRGIGKTTIARIFAKAIRCEALTDEGEPCLTCSSCTSIDAGNSLDYLEIDGASNNSVEDIRELIENVQYLPTSGNYKVYVIDEVHMLSVSAFNALLKTLEEPPAHVAFIFATTDPQKLLGTVLSRCQRFDFKTSTVEQLIAHLKYIASEEGIEFENEKLITELAKQGKGSFRDSLSLFDQVLSLSNSSFISEEVLMLSLGMAKSQSVIEIINGVLAKDKKKVIDTFELVLNENIDLKTFSIQVLDKVFALTTQTSTELVSDIDSYALESVSNPELFWIYENLAKDLEWAISSIDPEKTILFSLVKTTIREELLNIGSQQKLKKKVVESIPVKKTEIVALQVEEKPVVRTDYSWEGFIKFLYEENSALAMNLERGNLLNNQDLGKENAQLRVAFSMDSKIFHDYIIENQSVEILKDHLKTYLGRKLDFSLKLELINEEQQEKVNFQSSIEVEEDKIEKVKIEKKENILNNKYIKEAEKLFSSSIDKVILNEND